MRHAPLGTVPGGASPFVASSSAASSLSHPAAPSMSRTRGVAAPAARPPLAWPGLVLVLALLASGVRAQDVPALTGRVVDIADLLSPATEAALTARLAALEDSMTAQVVVLTIPSLGGAVLEEYATIVFRRWGLGQADADNGVLLLISRDDRQLRIEVGYGLEGSLTDARAGTIIREEIVPRFREDDFDGGAIAGVDAIIGSLDGTYEEPAPEPLPWWFWALFGVTFGSLPFFPLVGVLHTGPEGAFRPVLAGVLGLLPGVVIALLLLMLRPDSMLGFWPVVGVPILAVVLDLLLERHPRYGPARRARRKRNKAIRSARRRGASSVVVDGVTYAVPAYSSSSSSDGSGGGFSGGGGSSGGGGASGGW